MDWCYGEGVGEHSPEGTAADLRVYGSTEKVKGSTHPKEPLRVYRSTGLRVYGSTEKVKGSTHPKEPLRVYRSTGLRVYGSTENKVWGSTHPKEPLRVLLPSVDEFVDPLLHRAVHLQGAEFALQV
eukprot:9262450-Pyramimonas_sp.AAC.2